MADFLTAYNNTLGHEKGWTVDNGGQTYKGISRKGWPKWIGWKLIDQLAGRFGYPKRGGYWDSPQLDQLVLDFYKENYWKRISGDAIRNQVLANFIYDFVMNSNSALIQINRGLGARVTNTVNEDTLKIINERPAFAYLTIYNIRKNHIERLSQNPKLKRNKAGWVARLKSFPASITA